jgi:rhodanese-related sulfurtransferase
LVKEGAVTVVDVRPAQEYAAGHLPGALNMPVESLRRRSGELSRQRPLVVYCRGPYCVLALDALEYLHQKGFKVRRLEESVAEWQRAGLPVEGSANSDDDAVTPAISEQES